MDFSIDNMQRGKLAVHIAQALFIFISWCMMIAVFRNALLVFGGPIWYFILCFLTIPPLIYQTLTPMFERSRKWGNPYAFAILDVVYTVLWLSAFASVAAWNTGGFCFGACGVSEACVGLGFFIFLFFGLTSAMSIYGVIYFRRNGTLPGASRIPSNANMIDPDREAFSTAPHDDEYAPVHMNEQDHSHPSEMDSGSGDGSLGSAQHYDPISYSPGMGAGRGGGMAGPGRVVYAPPTVSDVSPSYRQYGDEDLHGGYDGETERVRFPAGNYN